MEPRVEELVCRAQTGDAAAFAQLIGRYERIALAIAYAYAGESHAARDVVQEAFLHAWQQLSRLREPSRFGPWLAGIVRNSAVSERRRQRGPTTALPSTQADPHPAADPAAQACQRESDQQIDAALQTLDPLSRAAVVLRYYEGLSSRRIGELLEISAAAVDMRLSRARQELRRLLADESAECRCGK